MTKTRADELVENIDAVRTYHLDSTIIDVLEGCREHILRQQKELSKLNEEYCDGLLIAHLQGAGTSKEELKVIKQKLERLNDTEKIAYIAYHYFIGYPPENLGVLSKRQYQESWYPVARAIQDYVNGGDDER